MPDHDPQPNPLDPAAAAQPNAEPGGIGSESSSASKSTVSSIDSGPGPESDAEAPAAESGRRPPAVLGMLGAGLVIGGTALALYSRFGAATRNLGDRWASGRDVFGEFALPFATVPERWSGIALIWGLILVVVIADLLRRSRAVTLKTAVSAWLLVLALAGVNLGWYAITQHIPGVLAAARFEYPLFGRLPTAAAAIGLIFCGTVLLIGLLRPALVRAAARRSLVLGLGAGLLVSATVAAVAVHAGDDGTRVDHVTADSVPVPAIPATLGTERYRVPRPFNSDGKTLAGMVIAGTGFVIATENGLTAYDGATGTPRWHYLRSNVSADGRPGVDYTPGSLMSLDGGSTVLAQWRNGGLTAFDAVTGELLWRESEFADLVFGKERWPAPRERGWIGSTALLATDKTHTARYDARTGKHLWSTEVCESAGRDGVISTDAALYRIATCIGRRDGAGGVRLVVTALDPATGAIMAERELGRATDVDNLISTSAHTAGAVVITFHAGNDPRQRIVIDKPEHLLTARTDSTSRSALLAVDSTGTDMLIQPDTSPDEPVVLEIRRVADGTIVDRIEVPGHLSVGASDLFLSDELVEAALYDSDSGAHTEVRAWRRVDGALVNATPITRDGERCSDHWLVSVPGATLVPCVTDTGADLVGFRPNG
ncbi:PQQ-binding-like beta-propeller repeat protein [Nocardia sp. NPDC056000]|uniref:outer membrane protein assembly factor BamB family protein n=1 Tax=Nocardia sp. NPDC056000 TaxID=3345674 RepID=UPI0035D974D9